MLSFADIASWNWWLILALVIGSAELLAPGFYLLWIACALALTGLIHIFVPLQLGEGLIALALFSPLTLYGGHHIYRRGGGVGSSTLNRRAEANIGRRARLQTALSGGEGRIRLDGTSWKVEGPDMKEGSPVEIISVERGIYRVRAVTGEQEEDKA